MTITQKIGIILANLGTPDAPQPAAISRYLADFLMDPRVVDLPRWKWYPLLKAIILPMRSKRIAQNYQSIWTEQGSPLLAITKQQQAGLQAYLNEKGINAQVEIAMTYGNPSMQSAVKNLLKNDVERIIVLPLYPQYSSTTTGALIDAFNRVIAQERNIVPFEFIHSYHLNENYINALVDSIKVRLKPDEFLLFSYHGIPLRYENMGDYYRQHCKQTTIAIVDKLGLTENQWNMTLKDATNEAIRDWCCHPSDTYYVIGSTVGPHPYPDMVARLQSVISEEIRKQLLEHEGRECPDYLIACVGGGSNAAGTIYHYVNDPHVQIVLAEAGGKGIETGMTAATIALGKMGIIHGSRTYVIQNEDGQIEEPYSISAGLDYPGIGPMHANLAKQKRAIVLAVNDDEAIRAAYELTRLEGIIPALESAHALGALEKMRFKPTDVVVLTVSGRGDKDIETYLSDEL